MTLIEALMTKRPEDKKVADWVVLCEGEKPATRYAFDEEGKLVTSFFTADRWYFVTVTKNLLTRTDFTPMWATPAPMVPEKGEVWGYTAANGVKEIIAWAHCYPDDDKVTGLTWALDGVLWVVTKNMIHGQNGWRLVWSPNPERMRRAQNGRHV